MTSRSGTIRAVCTSRGGIPKLPVEAEFVTPAGLSQDRHAHEKHVQPKRAVLLMDEELFGELAAEGYQLHAGAIGENLTVHGLRAQQLVPGTRLRCRPDGPLLEITEARKPCFVLDQIDRQLKVAVVGRGGMFTRVIETGRVFPGQTIEVVAGPLRAGVLVGGQSRRMGIAKHLLLTQAGLSILEHICEQVRPLVMDVVLLGTAAELPASVRMLRQLEDARPDAGPLAGLAALLNSLVEKCGPAGGWGLLLAADMPRLAVEPLARLWNAIQSGLTDEYDAAAFSAGDERLHACCAFYHTRALPAVRLELDAGRSLQRVLSSVRTLVLSPNTVEVEALADADTPAEYRALTCRE